VGPWFIFLAYDLILYLVRTITYEIPIIGGRARGKERPRAPSLKERPSGDPRVMGIGVPGATYMEREDMEEEERQLSEEATPEPEPHAYAQPKRKDILDDLGFAGGEDEDENGDKEEQLPQRVFSIGGTDERASWTEVNARKRLGFKDDEGQS
jgi:hypothetical protein